MKNEEMYKELLMELEEADKLELDGEAEEFGFSKNTGGYLTLICC